MCDLSRHQDGSVTQITLILATKLSTSNNIYIHLVNFLRFHEIFEIIPGDNGNCTSKHLLNKKMTMRVVVFR